MCGRFTQHYTWAEVHAFLNLLGPARNLQPHYNIAPTTTVDVVRMTDYGRELVQMRWQLVPAWTKNIKDVKATFNARIETAQTSPAFREAFKKRRCIIPASGFYEWTGDKNDKQPHFFSAADSAPVIALAGLWEIWTDEAAGESIQSCTILTTEASQWMSTYHNRMPVLLERQAFNSWLDGTLTADRLQPAAENALREWRVSKRLNNSGVGDDDPEIIVEAA